MQEVIPVNSRKAIFPGFCFDASDPFSLVDEMLRHRFDFEDPRLPFLLWRMVCRNYPGTLDDETRMQWRSFCAGRLLFPPERMTNDFHFFTRKIDELSASPKTSPHEKLILRDLEE